MDDFDISDVILAIFITAVLIGIIWIINDAFGAYIPTSVWLLIIGVVGILGIYLFTKVKE